MHPSSLRTILLASTSFALAAGGAYAQEAESAGNEVVVTGTRLQATGFQAPTPVTVVGQEAMEARAPTTISDVVNELPAFRQSATNGQNQRGNGNGGQNRVDLRGLGEGRTLVLVDGRRMAPTNIGGSVDTNLIPTPLVDRVEVVTGGASAAYGSDAVSGVVNFVLKQRIQGIQGSVQYGVSQENDNIQPSVALATGFDFAGDRGHVVAGADYTNSRGVRKIYSRDWGRKESGVIAFGTTRAAGVPAQGLAEDVQFSAQTDGSIIISGPLRGTAFGPGGVPFNFQYGTVVGNVMYGGTGSPDGNPFGNWFLSSPYERMTGFGRASYDLTENLTIYTEYQHGENYGRNQANFHQTASLIVPITNPYIPADTRQRMMNATLTSITIGRYDTEVGGLILEAKSNFNRGTFGIEGTLGDNWRWDAYYQKGVTDGNQVVYSNLHQANFLAATYVVTGPGGTPICGPTATNPNLTGANASRIAQIQPNCVPFNIFGRDSASPAAVDYIKRESSNKTRYEQEIFAANLSGEPFSTWAGPVSMAVGAEQRKEFASSLASDLGAIEAFLSNNGSTYSGGVDVTEGYIEAGVPLLRDVALAKALDLNGAVRRTNYSTSGNVTTWKVGATWELNDVLRMRTTRSRDIRAPNISQLFSTGTLGTNSSVFNPINGQTGQLFTRGGGNAGLTPEIADSWTAGVVVQPEGFLDGLRFGVDYYSVKIEDVISTVSAANIMQRCANGLSDYCALIEFNSSAFGIAFVRTVPANLDQLETNGVDIEVDYRVPMEALGLPGRLDIRSFTTYVGKLATTDAVGTIDRAGSGANGGLPSWISNLSLTYKLGRVTNTLQARYNSSLLGDATLVGPDDPAYNPAAGNSTNHNLFPSHVYWNWTGAIDFNSGDRELQLFGVINNLLDKDPPAFALAAFSFGGSPYDVVGRMYKVGVRFNF